MSAIETASLSPRRRIRPDTHPHVRQWQEPLIVFSMFRYFLFWTNLETLSDLPVFEEDAGETAWYDQTPIPKNRTVRTA